MITTQIEDLKGSKLPEGKLSNIPPSKPQISISKPIDESSEDEDNKDLRAKVESM